MPDDNTPPILGLSGTEAAHILGVSDELYVYRLVSQGVIPKAQKHQRFGLDRGDVERVALERYRPGHPYWATSREAEQLLGLSKSRVDQLVRAGRIPYVEHHGRRYFRRHQLQVVANARESRRVGGRVG